MGVGEVAVLAGCILAMLGGLGVVRGKDALVRMHSLTKASTLGVAFVTLGGALVMTAQHDVASLVLACVLQFLTLPVASNLMSRATYYRGFDGRDTVEDKDELAEAIAAGRIDPRT